MGNVKGLGSRVELLYSSTSTDATGGVGIWVVDKAGFTPPSWCRNVMFTARIHAIVIGPGANLIWAAVRYDSSGGIYTTSAGAERGMEATSVVTPTENNGIVITIGLDVPIVNTTYNGTSTFSVPTLPFPKIGFSHNWLTAPTSWTIRWAVYGSG